MMTVEMTVKVTGKPTVEMTVKVTGTTTVDVTRTPTVEMTVYMTGTLTAEITGTLTADMTGMVTGMPTAVARSTRDTVEKLYTWPFRPTETVDPREATMTVDMTVRLTGGFNVVSTDKSTGEPLGESKVKTKVTPQIP